MRSMWKGAISFGLVMIPVRLYAATEQKDISFRQVHRDDGGRIKFRRVCSIDGEEVPYEDVAKGYELPTGEMVVLTDEDMSDLPLPTARAIEVLQFAPADQLDPILFNRSYYVEPEAAGARAYVLLRDALERSGRVAVAQVALRQRETLATVRSRDGVLVLETLLWPDEIRDAAFPFLQQDIEVRPQELSMAASLIDSMTSDFDPDAYHDGYREALAELVEAKVQGMELVQPSTLEIASSPSTSLADALKASLAAAQQGSSAGQNGKEAKALESGTEGTSATKASSARSSGKAASSRSAPAKTTSSRSRTSTTKTGTAKSAPAKSGTSKAGDEESSSAKSRRKVS
jgi:DNA end-binding protein Ku